MWHGDIAYVSVHIDALWSGAPSSEGAMTAMRARVLTLNGVGAARIIPRNPPSAPNRTTPTPDGGGGGRPRRSRSCRRPYGSWR